MSQNIRIAVRTSTDHYGSTLPFNVVYGRGLLNSDQLSSITTQSPTIKLVRYNGPGYIASETNISTNGLLVQTVDNTFTSTFNQSDLIDILIDGAYYTIGGSDNYSTGYVTNSPYYDGSQGYYFIKWNAAQGKFYSAGSINGYNPVTGGGTIFNDYEPGDALYYAIDPLITTIEFLAGLPKGDK